MMYGRQMLKIYWDTLPSSADYNRQNDAICSSAVSFGLTKNEAILSHPNIT